MPENRLVIKTCVLLQYRYCHNKKIQLAVIFENGGGTKCLAKFFLAQTKVGLSFIIFVNLVFFDSPIVERLSGTPCL